MSKDYQSIVPERVFGTIIILNPQGDRIVTHVGKIISDTVGAWIVTLLSLASPYWNAKCQEPGFLGKTEVQTWEETDRELRIVVQLKD